AAAAPDLPPQTPPCLGGAGAASAANCPGFPRSEPCDSCPGFAQRPRPRRPSRYSGSRRSGRSSSASQVAWCSLVDPPKGLRERRTEQTVADADNLVVEDHELSDLIRHGPARRKEPARLLPKLAMESGTVAHG